MAFTSRIDRTLPIAVVLLVTVFALFEFSALDTWVQDFFYQQQTRTWLVDAKDPTMRLLFYTGPKVLIWILAISLLGIIIFRKGRARILHHDPKCRGLWVVIATLATAPALVALSKATTNVFCPYELTRYGGDHAYLKVLETYKPGERPMKRGKPVRGRGFPAGHASGGFALLSLAGLGRTRRGVAAGIGVGLLVGSAMGTYQILKGAHFLSHTLITAIFCWIVFLVWRRLIGKLLP